MDLSNLKFSPFIKEHEFFSLSWEVFDTCANRKVYFSYWICDFSFFFEKYMKICQLVVKYGASSTSFRWKLPDEREKSPISRNTGGNLFSLITFYSVPCKKCRAFSKKCLSRENWDLSPQVFGKGYMNPLMDKDTVHWILNCNALEFVLCKDIGGSFQKSCVQ